MSSSTGVKVSVFMAKSLDGFIAREDGDVAWLHEGEPLPAGDDAGYAAFFSSIDVLLMGRGTFDKVLGFDPWPYADKPVRVVSNSLSEVPERLRERVKIKTGTPQVLVEKLTAEGFQHVYLDGGKLIQSFLRAGLVNEMTLTTIPILLGRGIPLFGELTDDMRLKHVRTQTWDNGMVQSTYRIP